MIKINYQKRKNSELFKRFEEEDTLFLSKTQNYIPIYSRFFGLNETNYNNINLNNTWFILNINKKIDNNIHLCKIKNLNNDIVKSKNIFFKMAPLLDPYKYMIGKYENVNDKIFKLPNLNSTTEICLDKMLDVNNSAYVDGLFLFLSSQLINTSNFIHSVEYYGSYLALKNNFKINIFDDLDYLSNSDFFNKNKNVLFKVDNYDHLIEQWSPKLKPPLLIGNNVSLTSITSIENTLFEDIFEDASSNAIDLQNLKNMSLELEDVLNVSMPTNQQITLNSSSSCSSRSSHTNNEDCEDCEDCEEKYVKNGMNDLTSEDYKNNHEDNNDTTSETSNNTHNTLSSVCDDDEDTDEDDEDEVVNAIISKFPVQVIGMECCQNTFDELILNNKLTTDEWLSVLMQIIMILIAYQKTFDFTHNDLHTNNVMYNHTDKKYLYYCYNKKHYKVPTFGKIFKIIDFGRSIFKYDGKTFCSDSFKIGGDASTQYNTEPYLNDKKPRIEPNFSFDLCRLACSIFDYMLDDFEEIKELNKIKDPVKRIIYEWCLDDKGINMLYKNNGSERYPGFKLYKMISRCVHNHTPHAQLNRPEFDAFSISNIESIKNPNEIINIDNMLSYN